MATEEQIAKIIFTGVYATDSIGAPSPAAQPFAALRAAIDALPGFSLAAITAGDSAPATDKAGLLAALDAVTDALDAVAALRLEIRSETNVTLD